MDESALPIQHDPVIDSGGIDLRRVWITLLRYKWSIITLPILVAMLVYLYVSTLTPVYRGSSSLLIEHNQENVVGIRGVENISANMEYLQTQFELLKSRGLAEDVVVALDLANHQEFDPRQQEPPLFNWRAMLNWRTWLALIGVDRMIPGVADENVDHSALSSQDRLESTVTAFAARLTIAPRRNTQIVDIHVEMNDPRMAAAAANAVARGYIERQMEGRMAMTEQATAWMSERLVELRDQLDASERRLQRYVEEQDLVNMGGVTAVEASELSQLNSRLVEARQSFARAENQFAQISQVAGDGWRNRLTVPVVRSNELVSEFLAAEAEARARVDELSQRYGSRHPTMIQAQDELSAAIETLRSQVEQVVATIEQDFQLAEANLRSLETAFETNRDRIREVQRKEYEFRELQREVDTNRTLYDTFLNRLKETLATADIEDANARIIDTAVTPRHPVKPRKARATVIAALMAFLGAIGLAILREQFDNRLRSSAEIEEKLHLPLVGWLPLQRRGGDRRTLARLYHADTNRAFSEAVRTIRTGVVLSGLDNPKKVIVITSTVPGEGKSTLATNLATALGHVERVLLLEADMRKPAFRTIFNLSKEAKGLADLVADDVSIESAIHKVDGIDVIPCGTIPPNPLELLSSWAFGAVLERLQERYERIVIDAPPVQAVSDPLVLSTHASAVLYVVKADATPVPLVQKGIGRLAEIDAPITGVVLDQVNIRKTSRYGYGYGYKYSEMDYYDYYSDRSQYGPRRR